MDHIGQRSVPRPTGIIWYLTDIMVLLVMLKFVSLSLEAR